LNGEILIVNDNSLDGTDRIVDEIKKTKRNVNCLTRFADHGLSQSVADGFTRASSNILVVIDANFSHPPSLIPELYEKILAGNDAVNGSRYKMEGRSGAGP